MHVDRHKLWRIVGRNRDSMDEAAPDEYGAVVEVTLYGREAPLVIDVVETSRSDFPWILFHVYPQGGGERAHHEDVLVFAREDQVQRVEVRYVRKGKMPLGFAYRDLDEHTDSTVAE